MKFTESTVEEATLEWFQELGYDYRSGPEIAHDGLFAERKGSAPIRANGGLAWAGSLPAEAPV